VRAATIELARRQVIEMREPILDFAFSEDGALFTLSPLKSGLGFSKRDLLLDQEHSGHSL